MRKWRLKRELQREAFFSYLIGISNLGRSFSLTSLNYLVTPFLLASWQLKATFLVTDAY